MNDRDFKLLVRQYLLAREYAHYAEDPKGAAEAVLIEAEAERKIRKELERFTEKEQEELPFKD